MVATRNGLHGLSAQSLVVEALTQEPEHVLTRHQVFLDVLVSNKTWDQPPRLKHVELLIVQVSIIRLR